ncbi:MAG: NADH-quinone oxidoreductase subunit K [Burkholderiales bacterium]|jgi:multicomponent Na+:H+ antiporter subunit C|nr:NADH-quinone oxidoreductase subunit K [Microcystis sp. M015S1]MCA3148646.1 NADH-quinone oxidoreductase subunit K [Burkholderiales bacterium]MCA3153549.1 NADH-quinone oxidoreductase subunit K [Burkholderiales bacterium]MCA3156511.1 NADH-quinone oxidoreductase subunit K [Burkholderiales bacterium]MCA3159616.1 NADH-quinone oxidoreductase subunit K [Burkholderiales bacterium]
MNYWMAMTLGTVIAAGSYLVLSRDLLRSVIGLSLLGSAINLLVFSAGRLNTQAPPIIREGETILSAAANPLPQALVLTAIVIGFSLLCFSLVLIIRLVQLAKTRDSDQLRSAEPVSSDALKPPLSED